MPVDKITSAFSTRVARETIQDGHRGIVEAGFRERRFRQAISISTATVIGECSTLMLTPDWRAIVEHRQSLTHGKWNLEPLKVTRGYAHRDLPACGIERDFRLSSLIVCA